MDDCRRPQERVRPLVGLAVAVRQGVRSRRPAGKPRCPSGTAVQAGVRVGVRPSARSGNPTACRAWKVQENRLSWCWRSARRRLAPTTRPWPPTTATSARAAGPWDPEGARPNTRGCSRSTRQRLAPTTRPWPRYRVTRQPQRRAPGPQEATPEGPASAVSVVAASGRTQPTARAASLMPTHMLPPLALKHMRRTIKRFSTDSLLPTALVHARLHSG